MWHGREERKRWIIAKYVKKRFAHSPQAGGKSSRRYSMPIIRSHKKNRKNSPLIQSRSGASGASVASGAGAVAVGNAVPGPAGGSGGCGESPLADEKSELLFARMRSAFPRTCGDLFVVLLFTLKKRTSFRLLAIEFTRSKLFH